jgi:hypothetical protein
VLVLLWSVVSYVFNLVRDIYNIAWYMCISTKEFFQKVFNLKPNYSHKYKKQTVDYNSKKDRESKNDSEFQYYAEDNIKDYNELTALEHFYKNRELYLDYCRQNNINSAWRTIEDKKAFITSLYDMIHAKPEWKFRSNYDLITDEYVWAKNAMFNWDITTVSFIYQFHKGINKNTYKQEKRDYRAEWEQFKQTNSDYKERYQEFNKATYSSKNVYYDILGVTESDNIQAIKTAYRNKMKEYHPDKFVNASADEKHKADEMSKKINYAYSILKK